MARIVLFALGMLVALAPSAWADEGGVRGALAVVGERVLVAENATTRFTPASVQKLLVSTAALHHLGSDHRIVTRVLVESLPRQGVLAGDLVIEAAGDPTWSRTFYPDAPRTPLIDLARQLVRRGVQRVEGDVVVDARHFPGRSFPPSRAIGDLAFGFAAPLSALAVDDNTFRVRMAPGPRVGAPGVLERRPPAEVELRLVNRMTTVGAERHGLGTVDFLPLWEDGGLLVRGEYPRSEPAYTLDLGVPRGLLYAGQVFRHVLAAEGIEVAGGVRVRAATAAAATAAAATAPGAGARVELARHRSPTLADRLVPILRDSHNWHAEMLLRTLAWEETGVGRSMDGLEVLQQFLVGVVGLPTDAVVLDDASGLSPFNLLTPRAVVGLLQWARSQPWFGVFAEALASNGQGTLEAWPALPLLRAKTGTLRGSLALAGYLETGPGQPPVTFAIFLGHRAGERPPQRAEIARWLRRLASQN